MYDKDVLLLKALKDKTAMLKSVGVKPLKKDIQNSKTLPNRSTESSCHHLINNPKMFNGETDDLAIKPCIPH